jgi:hypothetical protein
MGAVVRLSDYQNRETVALLRALLMSAKSGDLFDIDVRVRTRAGEHSFCTGSYKDGPPPIEERDSAL